MFQLRFVDRVKFFMERQFVKGALFQLLIVAAVIGLISLVGGLLVYPVDAASISLQESVWWAFLRLTDPGYLGDDEGTWRRVISTFLTVSGYVVFLGALVAIMTQRLIAVMRELEQGLTPVTMKDHVVILGWTNRTVPLVRELVRSEKTMRPLLLLPKTGRLRVVILVDQVSTWHARELQDDPAIGPWMSDVVLRSGSALQPDALHRAACLNASVVIIPSGVQGAPSLVTSDVETIKALLSLDSQARHRKVTPPYVVAEVQDIRKLPLLRSAYSGRLEVVAGDTTISRLLAQNVLHPGLSAVFNELMTAREGNEFYLRAAAPMVGKPLAMVAASCPKAIVCGVLRSTDGVWQPLLNASSDLIIEAQDQLVIMAESYEHTDPKTPQNRLLQTIDRSPKPTLPVPNSLNGNRLLILGWNHHIPALIHELSTYAGKKVEIDLVSVMPIEEREVAIQRYSGLTQSIACRHIETDYMREGELRDITPAAYDTIILVSSDRLPSGEEADARVIVGYMILDEMLRGADPYPQILLELSDPDNEPLIIRNQSETIISPLILSHLLGQLAQRPELRLIFDELFTVGGAEILFRPPGDYGITQPLAFWKLEATVAKYGETALGVYREQVEAGQPRLILNPVKDTAFQLAGGDKIVVLTTTAKGKR